MSATKVILTPADQHKCPQCGTPLPTGVLTGLCPACLLKMGAAPDTVTEGKRPPFNPPSVADLAPLFPQLEILELIGKGGMGAVYKARQKQLDRIVALKILPPGIGDDPAFAERFTREARALAKLNHPGIVTLYEFGRAELPLDQDAQQRVPTSSSLYFFLMEFVDGVNLRQLLHAGRVSAREALAIVPQICDALQFAHDQGIVHRDIKPENILLDRRGRVKVADFGLAKIVGTDAPLTPSLSPSDGERVAKPGEGSPVLTDAGKVMGTPQYMSPEQIEAPAEVDHRADIYALGVVFYQMLTGELPGKPLQPPSNKVQVDVRLDEVVLRALEKKPELRYQQASVLKTQIETIAASTPSTPVGSSPAVAPPGMYQGVDHRSKATLFGLPLVHVATGIDPATGRKRVARGIVAIGDVAQGVVAFGGLAMGGVAFGGGAVGVLAFGGAALGLVSFGGLAIALLAALGGGAIAPIALGGCAGGYFAFGGQAFGVHVYDSIARDPVAEQFFLPWAKSLVGNQWLTLIFLGFVLPIGVGVPLWLQLRLRRKDSHLSPNPMPAVNCPVTMDAWLALMDEGDYARSWETAAPHLQRRTSKGDWVARLEKIRQPLGEIQSRKILSITQTVFGSRYEAKYESSLDGLVAATETVTYAKQPNGEWRAIGYLIRPASEAELRKDPAPQKIYRRFAVGLFLAGTLGTLLLMVVSFRHDLALIFGGCAVVLAFLCLRMEQRAQRDPHPPGFHALMAFSLFLVGTLGTLAVMTVTYRHDGALLFGGTALAMSLVFALMSWRERLGKFVVLTLASMVILAAVVGLAQFVDLLPGSANSLRVRSDYIGQAYFPEGDSIEINSVERTQTRITVKGRYNLVSADSARLALHITSTNNPSASDDPKQSVQIAKGRGEFELTHSHLVPGLPHLNMYAEGRPFAELYFGNKEEAAEERRLVLGDSKLVQGVAGSPATDVSKSLDSTGAHSIIHFRFVARDDETNAPVDLLSNPYDRTGDRKLRVLKEVVLDGSAIGRAGLQPGKNGKTEISFFWSDSGRRSFAEVTAANVGRQLAIVYDNEVLTAPRINEAIDAGIGKITGDFQDAEAERIVRGLNQPATGGAELRFGETVECVLPQQARTSQPSVFLALASGRWLTNPVSAGEARDYYQWIQQHEADVSGGSDLRAAHERLQTNNPTAAANETTPIPLAFCYDAVVVHAGTNAWETATPTAVKYRWELMTQEPEKQAMVGKRDDVADTYYFRTRDNHCGLLQVLGFSDNPRGVKIRCKLVQSPGKN